MMNDKKLPNINAEPYKYFYYHGHDNYPVSLIAISKLVIYTIKQHIPTLRRGGATKTHIFQFFPFLSNSNHAGHKNNFPIAIQ